MGPIRKWKGSGILSKAQTKVVHPLNSNINDLADIGHVYFSCDFPRYSSWWSLVRSRWALREVRCARSRWGSRRRNAKDHLQPWFSSHNPRNLGGKNISSSGSVAPFWQNWCNLTSTSSTKDNLGPPRNKPSVNHCGDFMTIQAVQGWFWDSAQPSDSCTEVHLSAEFASCC